jgi:hypothetical protein
MSRIVPFKQKFTSEKLCDPGPGMPYGSCFIFSGGGQGRIRMVSERNTMNDDYIGWLTVNGVPILSWRMENGCPTCEQILQSGNNAFDTQTALRQIHGVDDEYLADNPDWYEAYYPLLGLFDPGIYFMSVNEYYPTDGEGNLFWGSYEQPRTAAAVTFGSSPHPCFLIATQVSEKYSRDRHERGKETFKTSPGIAYHLDGYLSVLLDGHHRALAAAEASEPFICVTISRALWYWKGGQDIHKLPTGITGLFGLSMEAEHLSKPATRWLRKNQKITAFIREHVPDPFFQADYKSPEIDTAFIRARLNVHSYPTVEQIIALGRCKKILNTDVDNAFNRTHACPDLAYILSAFISAGDPRTRELALRVVDDDNWRGRWKDALKFLSRFDDAEVLAIFWDLALRDDIKHKEVVWIVDQYIKKHSDKYSD